MPIAIVGTLTLLGTVGAIVLPLAIVALLGYMAYDAISSRREPVPVPAAEVETRKVHSHERRIYLERSVARAFVILGGVFWAIAAFAGLYAFRNTGAGASLLAASVPLVASLVTLVIGWYWERLASVMLAVATFAFIAWGISIQFELGVWILTTLALIGPMLSASVLFWMARTEQVALELRIAQMEPAYITAQE